MGRAGRPTWTQADARALDGRGRTHCRTHRFRTEPDPARDPALSSGRHQRHCGGGDGVGTRARIKQGPGAQRALAGLIGAQGLVSVANSATQVLVVLRLLEMVSHGVAAITGIAFGLAGVATSAAAVFYTFVTRRL